MGGRAFPLLFAALLALAACAIGFALGQGFDEQLQLAARYTARVSFPLFILTYCVSSLVRLWPNDLWKAVLRRRRQWGLGFAFAHTVHLAALAWFNIAIQNMPGAQALLGGGLAYGLMFAMAATSNDASQRAMGVWWKRLHTFGIHWIWFIFAFSYFGRMIDTSDTQRMWTGLVFLPLCFAALGLRIAVALSDRRRAAVV